MGCLFVTGLWLFRAEWLRQTTTVINSTSFQRPQFSLFSLSVWRATMALALVLLALLSASSAFYLLQQGKLWWGGFCASLFVAFAALALTFTFVFHGKPVIVQFNCLICHQWFACRRRRTTVQIVDGSGRLGWICWSTFFFRLME